MRRLLPKLSFLLAWLVLGGESCLPAPQADASEAKPSVIETTVCAITKRPSAFNNKIVKVHGHLFVNFELSMLRAEGCDDAVWFEFASGAAAVGLVATVKGNGQLGGKNVKGKRAPPIMVRLVQDSNFEKFQRYMAIKAAEKACDEDILAPSPPDCDVDQVTATFIGRVDSVSEEVHRARLKQPGNAAPDWKGFGLMGQFEAQIVVQSVENVVAVDS